MFPTVFLDLHACGYRSCHRVETYGIPMVFQGLPRGRRSPHALGSLPARWGTRPGMRKCIVSNVLRFSVRCFHFQRDLSGPDRGVACFHWFCNVFDRARSACGFARNQFTRVSTLFIFHICLQDICGKIHGGPTSLNVPNICGKYNKYGR